MLLFPLFYKFAFEIILPIEIIHYIYILYLRANSRQIILYHSKSIREKTNSLKNIINYMVFYDPYFSFNNKYFEFNLLDNLNCIFVNNFSREIYPREFWQHLLHLISCRLMSMYNYFCIIGNDKRTNTYYKLFLQTIEAWFKLCKKHNIKLYISKYELFNKNIIIRMELNARKMAPIKSFKKYASTPIVLLNNGEHINIEYAREILKYYLL